MRTILPLLLSLLWSATLSAQSWTDLGIPGPGDRGSMSVVYDKARGVTVLYGGSDGTQSFSDTWEFDGTSWTQVATTGPSLRWSPSIAYDSVRGVTVLFGGYDSAGFYSDETWEWDGVSWTLVPVVGPPSRSDASMGFDPVRGVCVLFGGERHLPWVTEYSDTWEYDGNSWTQVWAGGLGHRENAPMCWDGINQRLMIAGGWSLNSFSTTVYNSCYAYDGSNWSYIGAMPSPVTLHAMLWDAAACKVVVQGGWNVYSTNRTMEYDGTGWSTVAPSVGPAAPYRYSMGWVHDTRRGVNLMVGGRHLSGSSYSWYGDTREYLPTKNAACVVLSADVNAISMAAGGTQTFTLDAGPSFAGANFGMALTTSGIWPLAPYGGLQVPLVPDPITTWSLANPNSAPLSGFAGTLDASGRATASLTVAPNAFPAYVGSRIHTAAVVFHPTTGQPSLASNAEALDIHP